MCKTTGFKELKLQYTMDVCVYKVSSPVSGTVSWESLCLERDLLFISEDKTWLGEPKG